jgi:DNA-binding transcriptional MerR regulator
VDKSPDAFRTISEVADDLDLPQHVLRFWETRFAQIRPLKRGGGRRYYRPDDVDLLRGIRHLLYGQGYTIRGVQRILKEQGLRFVQSLGRGEAVAPAPGPSERETDETPAPDLAPAGGFEDAPASDELFPELAAAGEARRRPAPAHTVLPSDMVMRLNGALGELMECRRLLAVARGVGVSETDGG